MSLRQLQSVSFYGKVYMYINNITFLLNKLFLGEKIIAWLWFGENIYWRTDLFEYILSWDHVMKYYCKINLNYWWCCHKTPKLHLFKHCVIVFDYALLQLYFITNQMRSVCKPIYLNIQFELNSYVTA